MKTYALLTMLALTLIGCTPELEPTPQPRGPDWYARGAWAWSIAIEQSANPQPQPQPSGDCENCNGTGRLGDGRVSVPCPVCGGDGKLDGDQDPEPEIEPVIEPQPEPEPETEPDRASEPAAKSTQQQAVGRRKRGLIGRAIFGN